MEAVVENEVCDRQKLRQMFNLPPVAAALVDSGEGSDYENSPFQIWYDDWASFEEMIPLDQFRAKYNDLEVDNFVYHRASGMVFNTLGHAHHQHFMGGLYVLHRLSTGWLPDFGDRPSRRSRLDYWSDNPNSFAWDNQEQYLKQGLGIYQSSCGKRFYRYDTFEMNAAEFNAFHRLEDWHIYTKENN